MGDRLLALAPLSGIKSGKVGYTDLAMKSKKGTSDKPALNNPHGANQYQLDPRQSSFLAYYLDPKSQSYGNAFKSAVLAGYEESYAKNILGNLPVWLSEKVETYQTSSMLEKAERNIQKFLDLPTRVQAMGAFGPIFEKVVTTQKVKLKNGRTKNKKVVRKVPVFVENGKLLEIQQKTSHFVAETVGRKRYGKEGDGAPVPTSIVNMTQIIINAPGKAA